MEDRRGKASREITDARAPLRIISVIVVCNQDGPLANNGRFYNSNLKLYNSTMGSRDLPVLRIPNRIRYLLCLHHSDESVIRKPLFCRAPWFLGDITEHMNTAGLTAWPSMASGLNDIGTSMFDFFPFAVTVYECRLEKKTSSPVTGPELAAVSGTFHTGRARTRVEEMDGTEVEPAGRGTFPL